MDSWVGKIALPNIFYKNIELYVAYQLIEAKIALTWSKHGPGMAPKIK